MDINKLLDKVMENEEMKGIPLIHIMMVLTCVLEAIGSGECFYTEGD